MSSEAKPRLWTYGDITIDANRIESVEVEISKADSTGPDEARVRVFATLTSGRTITLAKKRFKNKLPKLPIEYIMGIGLRADRAAATANANAKAADWAENAKAEILAKLNAFLSKAD